MKKNEVVGIAGAVAAGKAIDYSRQQLTPAQHYKTFEDVLKDYNQAKKGDVVFFSESIGQGKVHPVVITHHVKGEPRFLEFGIFNLNSGRLKDRLHAHTYVNNKFKMENASSLAGIYRNPNFDEAKFDAYIAKLPKNIKYNPLNFLVLSSESKSVSFSTMQSKFLFRLELWQMGHNVASPSNYTMQRIPPTK